MRGDDGGCYLRRRRRVMVELGFVEAAALRQAAQVGRIALHLGERRLCGDDGLVGALFHAHDLVRTHFPGCKR